MIQGYHSIKAIIFVFLLLIPGVNLSAQNNITFQVDMSIYLTLGEFSPEDGDIIVVRGSFNEWSGISEELLDPDEDNIYTIAFDVGGNPGEEIQFKYVIAKLGESNIWEGNVNESNPDGNRSFILTGNPETLPVVFFNNESEILPNNLLVTNTNDSGEGSLREALEIANNDGRPTFILFDPSLYGQTIIPDSQLPEITEDYTNINGDIDNDGTPDIVISSYDWMEYDGIHVRSAYNVIKGLVINNIWNPDIMRYAGISLIGESAYYNAIELCYIGTDLSGSYSNQNRNGVYLYEGAHHNVIGPGNVISGNQRRGIIIADENTTDNVIIGNNIGTNAAGNEPVPNTDGILIYGNSSNNLIGRTNPGEGNIIAFNWSNGVYLHQGYGNNIKRNSIHHNEDEGIYLAEGANNEINPPNVYGWEEDILLRGFTIPNALVEIFGDNYDEGESFIAEVMSDEDGRFEFAGPFNGSRCYNTTVTDGDGNTSGFSFSRVFVPGIQTEINANNWRVQMPNNGFYSFDQLRLIDEHTGFTSAGSGGEFPINSLNNILYAAGHYIGTIKDGEPSVSQVDHAGNDFVSGHIVNSMPSNIDDLVGNDIFSTDNRTYVIDINHSGDDWDNWPAQMGAPLTEEGEPLLISTQDSWTVMNDLVGKFHSGGGQVLGIEVERSTYSYVSEAKISDAFFVKWDVTNKSNYDYYDTYFGAWFDPDVDDAYNDLATTDPSRSLAIFYNADNNDFPKAFGAWLVRGPEVNGETLGLSAVTVYNNGEDVDQDWMRYNLLAGLDRWGNDKPFGPYDFVGDPVSSQGHVDNDPLDKRLIISTGPFDLLQGETKEIVICCIGSEGNDNLDAVTNIKETKDIVEMMYTYPRLYLSQTKGLPNSETPVRIVLSSTEGFVGADIKIKYDKSLLEINKNEILLTPLTTGFVKSVDIDKNDGVISMAIANPNPLTDNEEGIILRLPLKVKNNVDAGTILDLEFIESKITVQFDDLKVYTPIRQDGYIEVVENTLSGDVNQNGEVDIADAVLVLKALVELFAEVTPFQECLSDVNENNHLDIGDALEVLSDLVLNKSNSKPEFSISRINSTYEAEEIEIFLQDIDGEIGEFVRVPIRYSGEGNLYGLDLKLQYDAAAVQYMSCTQLSNQDVMLYNDANPGMIHLAMINDEGLGEGNNNLAYLTFKIMKKGLHSFSMIKSEGILRNSTGENVIPIEYGLYQNYPNPFNPATTINYSVQLGGIVSLKLYDVLGRVIKDIVNEYHEPGEFSVLFNAEDLASGMYIYRLNVNDFSASQKMILIK